MNRSLKDYSVGGMSILSAGSQHRRGLSLNGISRDLDENNLDLFSKSRRNLSVASSDESDVAVKSGTLSMGSVKVARSGIDDLLSSSNEAKHDYDWLLTPPGTPLFPSSDGCGSPPSSAAPRSSSMKRSVSTTKASRLSVSQSESNHSSRPTRSSSVTRSSLSSTHFSTNSNRSSSILNTSSASVSSYIRPSTPSTRSSSTARPSTPSSQPTSRPSTPSRTRSVTSVSSTDKTRPSLSSRPSTPSSRPQIPANLSSPAPRSSSRPSTPTRRSLSASLSSSNGALTSVNRSSSNGRNVASVSRPSSPSPRVRPPPQAIILPDFPLDTPPNLRTTLPDRPLSAGRSRPGVAVTAKGNTDTSTPANLSRRQSSPIVTRGRLTEPTGRSRTHSNGQLIDSSGSRKASHVSELPSKKPVKTSGDGTGFGRTISKKSLDMAIRHMDIRNATSGSRPLSGSTLFPHSIRSANRRSEHGHTSSAPASVNGNLTSSRNSAISENVNHINRCSANGLKDQRQFSSRLTDIDIYESSRYDTILLKEDWKSTNWLHSVDEKSDQGLIFDNGFEYLPEPFDPF